VLEMLSIRPFKLFALIQAPPSERIAHVQIPPRRGMGGVTLLETFLIVAATQVVDARRLFEFGTFLGSTTLNLALNTPDDAEVVTLDLGEEHTGEIKQDVADVPLSKVHPASTSALDFMGNQVSQKIKTLAGNSITFDFSTYTRTMDFIFIDGGHDLDTARSDSHNAWQMIRMDKPSCIMWHDYTNWDYDDLTAYLNQLSQERDMYHIGDTMLVCWFNDPANTIRSAILRD
jgi:hypothetical protein